MERALPTPAFASASVCARRDGFVGRRRSTGPTRRGANAEPATNDGPVLNVGRAWRESRAARTLCRATVSSSSISIAGGWKAPGSRGMAPCWNCAEKRLKNPETP